MSVRAKRVVVTRNYKPSPDSCTRALELLLKKAACGSRPEDVERGSNAFDARSKYKP